MSKFIPYLNSLKESSSKIIYIITTNNPNAKNKAIAAYNSKEDATKEFKDMTMGRINTTLKIEEIELL